MVYGWPEKLWLLISKVMYHFIKETVIINRKYSGI
jgi:hypothetical protein